MDSVSFSDYESPSSWNFRLKMFTDGSVQGLYSYNHSFSSGYKRTKKLEFHSPDNFSDPQRSIDVSLKRTIQKVYELAKCNSFQYFVTFTFNSEFLEIDSFDYSSCVKCLSQFTHRLSMSLSRNSSKTDISEIFSNSSSPTDSFKEGVGDPFSAPGVQTLPNNNLSRRDVIRWLLVPELHKSGRYHFHGLISAPLHLVPARHKYTGRLLKDNKGQQIYNIPFDFPWGWTTVTEIKNPASCANYITKYFTKQLKTSRVDLVVPKGKKRYWASRNLSTPSSVHLNLTLRDVVNRFASKSSYTKTFYPPVGKMSFFEFRADRAPQFSDYCDFLYPQFNKIFILLTNLFGCDRIDFGIRRVPSRSFVGSGCRIAAVE